MFSSKKLLATTQTSFGLVEIILNERVKPPNMDPIHEGVMRLHP